MADRGGFRDSPQTRTAYNLKPLQTLVESAARFPCRKAYSSNQAIARANSVIKNFSSPITLSCNSTLLLTEWPDSSYAFSSSCRKLDSVWHGCMPPVFSFSPKVP